MVTRDNSPAIQPCRFPNATSPARNWTTRAECNAARQASCTSPCCLHRRHRRRCRPLSQNRRRHPAAVAVAVAAAAAVGLACRRCTTRRPCSMTAN